ncbi:MAG: DUF4405 domain-containing protein [Steroidobacteraceae bacterium]
MPGTGARTARSKPSFLQPREVDMPAFLNRYATPLTLGLFLVSAISGVFLFLHVGQGLFHEMHEWLSILLLAPFALHVWKNWAALLLYLRRRLLWLPLLASLVAAAAFAWTATMEGEHVSPPMRAIGALTHAPLTDLSPLLKMTPQALQAELRRRGFAVGSERDTLESVAASTHASPVELLFDLLPQ